ncbi:hypothetical protein COV61_02650 [Candidatus Micrarchaeota archaeon CG11_big_fil_rev_8_21_14_0_20_47_5]|nr:MAG: hypothetical protein AUJ17_03210 [Candidatus Micrarchaeota archaeon CG1_02_47_40]PIN83597.1 MAG: hypothetical protein COV61_02650 [Candidatus Micrarchaeota archaeon CG11_big_fil_rev_8_21_14_0_20_47_5]
MHGRDFDINIEGISKIEGHAALTVSVRDNIVQSAKLVINENKRFYTQAVRGKPFNTVPQLVSRICGTCSIAHLTCCMEAVENAVGFAPSAQTAALRKLNNMGLWIRDHAMHLYLFCMPDIFGKDSVFEFKGEEEKWVKDCFEVKKAGNELCTKIAGRAIHSTFQNVGYFSNTPKKEDARALVVQLNTVRPKVLELIELFSKQPFSFETDSNFVSLMSEDYTYTGNKLCDSNGLCIPESNFFNHLHRVVMPYSQATGFVLDLKGYSVGALARTNTNKEHLHRETKKDCKKYLTRFPSHDVFLSNLAQAIEILHSIDYSCELLEGMEFTDEEKKPILPKEGVGVGAIEAPRGVLYYEVKLGKEGKVIDANLVIPTAQNQIQIEHDIARLVQSHIHLDEHTIEHDIEKLIRAYDPCMSCATHFLKVKWNRK